jgi:hypothetical protein
MGDDGYPRFLDGELRRRFGLVRELMAGQGVEALLLHGAPRRWVRSEEELAWLRHSAELTDRACELLEARIHPGLTEHDLVTAIHEAFLPEGGRQGCTSRSSSPCAGRAVAGIRTPPPATPAPHDPSGSRRPDVEGAGQARLGAAEHATEEALEGGAGPDGHGDAAWLPAGAAAVDHHQRTPSAAPGRRSTAAGPRSGARPRCW